MNEETKKVESDIARFISRAELGNSGSSVGVKRISTDEKTAVQPQLISRSRLLCIVHASVQLNHHFSLLELGSLSPEISH